MKPLLLIAGLLSTQLYAEEGDFTMALGEFNIGQSGAAAMAQLEYRFAPDWYGFRPQAGLFLRKTAQATGILALAILIPLMIAGQ